MMKMRGIFGALVVGAVLAIASPAMAGLDFANTATAVGASTANTRFNGSTAGAFGTQALTSGFQAPGANQVIISAPTAVGLVPEVAIMDFNYNSAGPGGQGFQYSFDNKAGDYGLVIQFGTIVTPGGGTLLLQQVQFSEAGTPLFSFAFGINRALTAADSDSTIFIDIPQGAIPGSQRDIVDVVRLQFVFSGSGTSFGINAVANPEPGTIALFGLGLLGLAGVVRRRRRGAVAPSAAGTPSES